MKFGEIEDEVSLVDFLAKEMGCTYVSDLTHLTVSQQQRLAAVLEKLPPDAASEAEWDDALAYIEKLPAQESAEEDRKRLLSALTAGGQGKRERQ